MHVAVCVRGYVQTVRLVPSGGRKETVTFVAETKLFIDLICTNLCTCIYEYNIT